jgi:hypothetical protein
VKSEKYKAVIFLLQKNLSYLFTVQCSNNVSHQEPLSGMKR